MGKTDATATPELVLMHLPPADLRVSEFHSRQHWGDWPGFRASVRTHGVISPPLGRWIDVGTSAGKVPNLLDAEEIFPTAPVREVEAIYGHRRRRAAIEEGLPLIPVLVGEYTDEEVIEIQAIENLEHAGSHPLDESVSFHNLRERGYSVKLLAERFHRDLDEVRDRLNLQRLHEGGDARKLYIDGEISHVAAALICRLPMRDQQDRLARALAEHAISDADIAGWIRRNALSTLTDVPWKLADPDMPGGSCMTCPKMTGQGAIQGAMFEVFTGKDRMCSDTPCFRSKMFAAAAARRIVLGDSVEEIRVESADTFIMGVGGRYIIPRSSGYVDAEAECPSVPGVTWLAAATQAGFSAKAGFVTDPDGRVRLVLNEKDVVSLVRRSVRDAPATSENARVEQAADPARTEARERADKMRNALESFLNKILTSDATDAVVVVEVVSLILPLVSATSRKQVAKLSGHELGSLGEVKDPSLALRIATALLVAEAGIDPPSPIVAEIARRTRVRLPHA